MDTDILPYVLSVCSALGGYEENLTFDNAALIPYVKYVMGDECLECLRDIKRYLRVDSYNEDRKVLKALGSWNILQNDLIPILLLNTHAAREAEAMGKRNEKAEKAALSIVELLVPMTWPADPGTEDIKKQLEIHRTYKEAFLTPGVLGAVLRVLIIPLSVPNRERTVRDHSLIRLTLSLFRNLLVIPDTQDHTAASAEEHRRSTMQEELLLRLQEESILELILTFASSSDESEYSQYNVTILEIFCAIFKGIDPEALFQTVKSQAAIELRSLINKEKIDRKQSSRALPTRHSRFGGTIMVKTAVGRPLAIHKNIADPDILHNLDEGKKSKNRRLTAIDDDYDVKKRIHSSEALACIRKTADTFLQCCFNPFFLSLRNDVELERSKIRTEDTGRFLELLNFFVRFQRLAMAEGQAARANGRSNASATPDMMDDDPDSNWDFDLTGAIMDLRGLKFVVKRIRTADEDKLYDELHIAVECFHNMLLTLNLMAESPHDEYKEISDNLQNNLFYEASTLEMMVSLMKSYKADMSKGYLRALVDATHTLLRMLEKYSKNKLHMFVRKKAPKKRKAKKAIVLTTESGAMIGADEQPETSAQQPSSDEDEGSDEETGNAAMLASAAQAAFVDRAFNFAKHESLYATEKVVTTYCSLLQDYKTLPVTSLKSITAMFHRIFFKVKAEAVFYRISTLDLFYRVLTDLPAFAIPRLQVHDDLKKLLTLVVRSMFQKLSEYPLLYVEVLFPKTHATSHRIQHGAEEDYIQDTLARGRDSIYRSDDEVEVRPGMSWSQQLGVAVSVMVEKDQTSLVEWIKTEIGKAITDRKEILRQRDMEMQLEELGVGDGDEAGGLGEKIKDFDIKGENEGQTIALEKCSELRLLLRQLKCVEGDEGGWVIPADQSVEDLELNVQLLEKFVADPVAANGKSLSELLRRRNQAQKRKKRAAVEGEEDEPRARKTREKKVEERKNYKSEQFIEDSDEDDENSIALFFQREAEQRARMSQAANNSNIVPIHELTKSLQQGAGHPKKPSKQKQSGPPKKAKNPLVPSDTDDLDEDSQRETVSRKNSKTSSVVSDDSDNEEIDEIGSDDGISLSPSPDGMQDSPKSRRVKGGALTISRKDKSKHSLVLPDSETDDPDQQITGGGKRNKSLKNATLASDDSDDEAIAETRSNDDGLLRSPSPDEQPESPGSPGVIPDKGNDEGSEKENEIRPSSPNRPRNVPVPLRVKRRALAISDRENDKGNDIENEKRLSSTDRLDSQRAKRRALAVSDGEDDDGSDKENELFNKRRAGRGGSSLVAAGRILDSSDEE